MGFQKGHKVSKEMRKKMKIRMLKEWKNPNSKFNSEETRKKMKIRMLKEWKNPNSKFNSEEMRKKIGKTLKRLYSTGQKKSTKGMKIHSKEYLTRLSKKMKGHKKGFKKGDVPWNKGLKGIHLSPSTEFKKGQPKENHNNWQGGISFVPYTFDWTDTLRKSIRERDKYICQFCGQSQGDVAFPVHHIDYNKKNCNPLNLITLCLSCHMKTSFNRKKWINFFSEKLKGGVK